MDDLDLIRKTLAGPEPSAATTFRARNRLTAAIQADGGGDNGAPTHRAAPRSRRRWMAGLATAAVIVAAAVAVPLTVGNGSDPTRSPGGEQAAQAVPASAPDLLLAAATRAGRESVTTGRYWHVSSVGMAGRWPVGGANRYFVRCLVVDETWVAREPNGQSWEGRRELGCAPASADDEKAWKAAGSPDHWDVPQDTVPPSTKRLTTGPGQPTLTRISEPVRYLPDLGAFDAASMGALPGNAAALRSMLDDLIATKLGHPTGTPAASYALFTRLSGLLATAPLTPATRAAAFTVLAGIPGVRSLGTTQDSRGRSGIGVQLDAGTDDEGLILRLILDPTTYLLLGSEYTSGNGGKPRKQGVGAVLVAEWTDANPTPPAIP